MNRFTLFVITLLAGCTQLMHGQIQPVKAINEKQSIFFTTCSGAVEDWSSCNNKARNTCPSDFKVIDKLDNANGGKRQLTFQCKK